MATRKTKQRHLTTADRKAQVLAFMLRHVEERRFPPTKRELAAGIKLSLGRVQQIYEELVDEGVIERAKGQARAYVVDRQAAARFLPGKEVRHA